MLNNVVLTDFEQFFTHQDLYPLFKVYEIEYRIQQSDVKLALHYNIIKRIKMSCHCPAGKKPVQSQKNNVRTTFSERCSNVILLTLNRFSPAG